MKLLQIFFLILLGFVLLHHYTRFHAASPKNKEEILTVRVIEIVGEKYTSLDGRKYLNQTIKMRVIDGSIKDRIITEKTGNIPIFKESKYQKGDKLIVGYLDEGINNEYFYIIGYSRTDAVMTLILIFAVLTILIADKRGFMSILGMLASFIVIFLFILPFINRGYNPVLVSILGAILIIPLTFYLSHGINKKTTIAIVGTLISLTITSILSKIFIESAHLSGLVYDEIETLLYTTHGSLNLKGLLTAGTIIGTLGILDDISISQSSIVEQLKESTPKIELAELYKRSMAVGKDHIASVVNTLILVYTGASLSTLLLFTEFPRPLKVIMNSEAIVIPVVTTLIGSIGLILTVPITTIIACTVNSRKNHTT